MAIKIDQKITKWSVVTEEQPQVTPEPVPPPPPPKPLKRPVILEGATYKLKNSAQGYNLYMTVNYLEDKPFEIFLDSSHTESSQWVKALSRLMSAMLRSPDPNLDVKFISRELMKVHSDQGYHAGGKGGFVAGIVQHIGKTLAHLEKGPQKPSQSVSEPSVAPEPEVSTTPAIGKSCPECGSDMVLMDGCPTCTSCGYSKCS
jgi:ribonucleoside-diphosphate reductase alpha chain